jgi:hypothetical protein
MWKIPRQSADRFTTPISLIAPTETCVVDTGNPERLADHEKRGNNVGSPRLAAAPMRHPYANRQCRLVRAEQPVNHRAGLRVRRQNRISSAITASRTTIFGVSLVSHAKLTVAALK